MNLLHMKILLIDKYKKIDGHQFLICKFRMEVITISSTGALYLQIKQLADVQIYINLIAL